ncbi:hypothetical protein Tco_0583500 [Tanacetum coccineum]
MAYSIPSQLKVQNYSDDEEPMEDPTKEPTQCEADGLAYVGDDTVYRRMRAPEHLNGQAPCKGLKKN